MIGSRATSKDGEEQKIGNMKTKREGLLKQRWRRKKRGEEEGVNQTGVYGKAVWKPTICKPILTYSFKDGQPASWILNLIAIVSHLTKSQWQVYLLMRSPKTIQALVIPFGCPSELIDKILSLKKSHVLVERWKDLSWNWAEGFLHAGWFS